MSLSYGVEHLVSSEGPTPQTRGFSHEIYIELPTSSLYGFRNRAVLVLNDFIGKNELEEIKEFRVQSSLPMDYKYSKIMNSGSIW